MDSDADLVTDRLCRVHEWREGVLSYAKAFSSSFKPSLESASVDDLFNALTKANRHDRETSLRITRRLISAILLSELSSSERAKLLENCWIATNDFYRDAADANPFTSLLCEPLESVRVPAIAYEIRRLSLKSHRARDSDQLHEVNSSVFDSTQFQSRVQTKNVDLEGLHVIRFLIMAWEGTLIPLSDVESGDLIKTVRKVCLRSGDVDSGNDVFQRLRPLLSNQLNSYIRPTFNSVYSIDVFPNILEGDASTPSRRRGILAKDGVGFTAFIDIPQFREAISNGRSQPKRSQHSPSSATPSPSSPFAPSPIFLESVTIEFLAAHCAWSFEIGRNSLRLTLLDSDGSLEGDGVVVDAAFEVSIRAEPQRVDQKCIIRLPKSKLNYPSHPRAGVNSTYLFSCFCADHPMSMFASNGHEAPDGSPILSDVTGFDDERLCNGSSGLLLLILLVRFDTPPPYPTNVNPSRLAAPPQRTPHYSSRAGEAELPTVQDAGFDKSNDVHRRTTSLPLVMISGPESGHEAESEAQVNDTGQVLETTPTISPSRRPRALPRPPGPEIATTAVFNDHMPHLRSPQPRRGSHSKQRSLPDMYQMLTTNTEPTSRPLETSNTSSVSLESQVSAATRRPLPKQPTLTIDTINLNPLLSQDFRGPSSLVPHPDPPSPVARESIETTEVSSALKTPTPGNLESSGSSRYDGLNTSLSVPYSNSDPHALSTGSGRLQASLRPLTPVSDVKDQDSITVLTGESDERSWRRSMVSEIECSFSVHLPTNRFTDLKGPEENFVIYPITIRYLAQYLHWWEQEPSIPSESSQSPQSFCAEVRNLFSGTLLQTVVKQASIREFLVAVLRRTEESSYRHFNNPKLNRVWSNLLRRSLQLDEQDMALSLSSALEVEYDICMREAMAMQPSDLLSFMDALQSLIDRQYGAIRVLDRFLQRVVDRTGALPKYLFLSNIRRIGDNPVAGGGFADVWKGKAGERTVALKVIRIFGLANPNVSQHQEFCMEAMIWRQFRHQNIYGVCTEEFSPRLALVSPWMRNGDVVSYLKSSAKVNRIALIAGIALGLLYLHTLKPFVVHGDLRGANVLIDDRGRPKLADFGLAKIVDSQASTVATTSFNGKGAMRWQSPELLDSSRFGSVSCGITKHSDVYAFASVCLEVFTKEVPFSHLRDGQVFLEVVFHDRRPPRPAPDSPAAESGLSDKIWCLMERCWSTQPLERPDMQYVVQELTVDCP